MEDIEQHMKNGFTKYWYYFPDGMINYLECDNEELNYVKNQFFLSKLRIRKIKMQMLDFYSKHHGIETERIEYYINEFINRFPLALNEKAWYFSEQWITLYLMIRIYKPKIIIETGCNIGWSSTFIALATKMNTMENFPSTFYTFDQYKINEKMISNEVETGVIVNGNGTSYCTPNPFPTVLMAVPDDLTRYIIYIDGDIKTTLPHLLEQYKEIDMFFHDSDHSESHMLWEFNLAMKHLSKDRGILCSHDITLNKAWEKFIPTIEYKGVEDRVGSLGLFTIKGKS